MKQPVYTYVHKPERGCWDVLKDGAYLFDKPTEREAAEWVEWRRIAGTKGMKAAMDWWQSPTRSIKTSPLNRTTQDT